jgi:hypothetical protein
MNVDYMNEVCQLRPSMRDDYPQSRVACDHVTRIGNTRIIKLKFIKNLCPSCKTLAYLVTRNPRYHCICFIIICLMRARNVYDVMLSWPLIRANAVLNATQVAHPDYRWLNSVIIGNMKFPDKGQCKPQVVVCPSPLPLRNIPFMKTSSH